MDEIPPTKSGVSREEFDRIIRRASELQFEDTGVRRPGDILGEEELLRIGQEVGLEPRHLRRALNETRAEALRPAQPSDTAILARLVGPGFVRVSRVVPGPLEALEGQLEAHLADGESLRRLRKRADRSLWEPAGGLRATLRRALKVGGSTYDLVRAKSLELSLVALGEGEILVTMTADLRSVRKGAGGGSIFGFGLTGGILGTGLGLAFLGFPLLGIPAALLGAGGGVAVGRATLRNESDRVRMAMEGILDRLEAGEPLATPRSGDWRARLAP